MKLEKQKLQVRKQAFQKKVLSYYKKHKRALPWRLTGDPYAIIVSEIMLQQTQTERVINYYEKFLRKYPTVQSLAAASLPEALALWSGLGYSRRLLNLIKMATVVANEMGGEFPRSRKELKQLPGIGEYTSAAVLAFWLNKKSPVIDTNIRKVYSIEFPEFSTLSLREQEKFVYDFIPAGKSRIWNNALMDYAKQFKGVKTPGTKKQTPFKGSEREVRGKVLKILLHSGGCTIEQLTALIADERLGKVIEDLITEGFIQARKGKYTLRTTITLK